MEFDQEIKQQGAWFNLKRFIIECRRVLTVTKKPTIEEFKAIVKVSGIGLAAIGLLGFIVSIIKQVFL